MAGLALVLLLPGVAQAGIYWTNGNSFGGPNGTVGLEIGRANLDGSHADRYWLSADTNATNLVVVDGTLLWAEWEAIMVARPGQQPQRLVALPEESCWFECDLAVLDGVIYWVDSDRRHVGRVSLDGTGADPSWFQPDEHYSPAAITSDGTSLFIEVKDRLLAFSPTEPASTLRTVAADPGMTSIWDIVAAHGHLYYAGYTKTEDGDRGRIGRVATSGAGVDPTWFAQHNGASADPYWTPGGLAADATHLYYTVQTDEALGGNGSIGRIRFSDGHVEPHLVTDDGDLFSPAGIAVDATMVPRPPSGVDDVKVRVPRKIRTRRGSLKVPVRVVAEDRDIAVTWKAIVKLGRKKVRLRTVRRNLEPGQRSRQALRARGGEKKRKALDRAVARRLKAGKPAIVKVVVKLRDVNGHQRSVRARVRLRR